MKHRRLFNVGILAALFVLSSCQKVGEVGALFREMWDVRTEVAKVVPCEEVGITLQNGKTLRVNVVNPVSDVISERPARTLEIARIAYASFASRSSLNAVDVTIVKRRRFLLLFTSASSTVFHFSTAQLAANAA